MPTVYRIQNNKGEGPYQTGVAARYGSWLKQCPGPATDFEVFRPQDLGCMEYYAFIDLLVDYRFAFPSRLAARRWFGIEGMLSLAREGFYLTEIEAEEVLVSDSGRQCIFRPKTQKGRLTHIEESLSLPA